MPSKKFPNARTTGLIVAGAVALIIAGVVLVVAVSQRPATPTQPITGDVTDIDLGSLGSGQGPDGTPLGTLDQGRVQFVDKDDPSRVEAELIYRRINPVGGGFYELDAPQAWIYLADGRALYIRANTGRVKMPNRTKSPESGQFVGDVVTLLFAPRDATSAGRPRDPMTDSPGLVARTNAIRFDTQLLEFASDDHVTIETPDARFEGTGVVVRGNQVLDRIEYMKVSRDGEIRYRIARGVNASPKNPVVAADASQGDGMSMSGLETGWEVLPMPSLDALTILDAGVPAEAHTPQPSTDAEVESARADEIAPEQPEAPVVAARPARQTPRIKEDLYEAVFADNVRVTQRQRRLAADTLFVWLRTIDNKLPQEAFGREVSLIPRSPIEPELNASPSAHAGGARLPLGAAVPAVLLGSMQTAAQWPPVLFRDGDDDLLLTWSGPLSLRPIAVSPPPRELSGGNHVALRFSANADGGEQFVRLSDEALGARGGCEELEYLATTRDMTLTSGPGSPRVWIGAPEAGCLAGDEIRVNLATGAAEMPGIGLLATLTKDLSQTAMLEDSGGMPAWLATPRPEFFTRVIDWQRRADFQFRTQEGEIRDALEWAEFVGLAFATDNTASLSGDLIRAEFVEAAGQTTVLRKLAVEGSAWALANGWRQPPGVEVDLSRGGFGEGMLKAETVEVSFAPSVLLEGDIDPTYLLARGGTLVGKDDASLSAPQLEASMVRDANGEIVVTDFEARGMGEQLAAFDRGDGVRASGLRIKGHAQRQTASVTGPRVQVARGPSVIDTTIVELDGLAGTMDVYAPGTFTHEQPTVATTGPGAGVVRVTATWATSMSFDDPSGVLECRGDTQIIKDEPLTRDTVRGERIRVELSTLNDAALATAEVPTAGSVSAGTSLSADLGDRRVLRATAFGSIEDRADGKPATVESRGYAAPLAPGEARTLETISYIESARLIADDVKGTIETPVAGRAVVFDQRSPDPSSESEQGAAAQGLVSASPRGTSSFRWESSMVFTRQTGLLELFEKIEVVHKPLENRPLTRMTSDRLLARLDLTSGGANAGRGGKLISAEAIGAVYAESGSQRLIGDRVMYDARLGTAVATAPEGGAVTLYDDRRATPFTARRLRWDLLNDQIEILEPATIVAPR